MVWVQVGEWERKYHLCEPCAATIQREVNWLAEGGYPEDGVDAAHPATYANRLDNWIPVTQALPDAPWFVLIKLASGAVRLAYLKEHEGSKKWFEVHRWGTDAQLIAPQGAVIAWQHLTDTPDD